MKKTEKQETARSNAQAAGERVLANRTAIKKLQKSIEEDMAIVRNWANSTGNKTLGDILIYERKNPPKLVFADGVTGLTEGMVSKLVFELPFQYTRRIIDMTAICSHAETDAELKSVLEKNKLSIMHEQILQIKHL